MSALRGDLAIAWAIARKDALSEARGRQAAGATLFFAALVLLLFGFALGPDTRRLAEAAPGLLWLAIVFGGLLTVARLHQIETDDGVKKVRTRFPTEQEFKAELQKEGMTPDEFREHIKGQISVIKLIDQQVKAKATPPSEADAKQLYETLVAIVQDKPLPPGKTPMQRPPASEAPRAAASMTPPSPPHTRRPPRWAISRPTSSA